MKDKEIRDKFEEFLRKNPPFTFKSNIDLVEKFCIEHNGGIITGVEIGNFEYITGLIDVEYSLS